MKLVLQTCKKQLDWATADTPAKMLDWATAETRPAKLLDWAPAETIQFELLENSRPPAFGLRPAIFRGTLGNWGHP